MRVDASLGNLNLLFLAVQNIKLSFLVFILFWVLLVSSSEFYLCYMGLKNLAQTIV